MTTAAVVITQHLRGLLTFTTEKLFLSAITTKLVNVNLEHPYMYVQMHIQTAVKSLLLGTLCFGLAFRGTNS